MKGQFHNENEVTFFYKYYSIITDDVHSSIYIR